MLAERPGVESGRFVRSPEQVALELPVAGPTSRMLAYVIDYALMVFLAILMVVAFAVAAPTVLRGLVAVLGDRIAELRAGALSQTTLMLAGIFFVLAFYAVEVAYFVFWETVSSGRSPGKMLVGLRVVGDTGLPVTLGPSLVRNLLRVVDALPVYYVAGLIAMVASADGKRLGDMAAGTLVIRLDRPPPVRALAESAPEAQAFRFDRLQASRIGPDEASLARETLRRIAQLDDGQSARLLAVAAGALVTRLGCEAVPPEQQRAFLQAVLEATRLR
jgi:uncharacterized RDD family membrane protein YckC